jgi:hypothetical protein
MVSHVNLTDFGTLAWLERKPAFSSDASILVGGGPWGVFLSVGDDYIDFPVRSIAESKFRPSRDRTNRCCQAGEQDRNSKTAAPFL